MNTAHSEKRKKIIVLLYMLELISKETYSMLIEKLTMYLKE